MCFSYFIQLESFISDLKWEYVGISMINLSSEANKSFQ